MSSTDDLKPLYRSEPWRFYLLWLVAALTYGGGDILTTVVAVIGQPGFAELNPVVTGLLNRFGIGGFIALKAAVFAVLLVISVKGGIDNDRASFYGPPLLAILLGVALTLWNVVGLYTA